MNLMYWVDTRMNEVSPFNPTHCRSFHGWCCYLINFNDVPYYLWNLNCQVALNEKVLMFEMMRIWVLHGSDTPQWNKMTIEINMSVLHLEIKIIQNNTLCFIMPTLIFVTKLASLIPNLPSQKVLGQFGTKSNINLIPMRIVTIRNFYSNCYMQ